MTDEHVITRRDFVRTGTGAALGASVIAGEWATAQIPRDTTSQVVIVRDAAALDADHRVDRAAVKRMIADALMRVTGKSSVMRAWLSLLRPTDVVGLVATNHLNPTHGEVIDAVRGSLVEAGIPDDNIRMAQGGPRKAAACTALISLPALKAHWLTGIGTVLKNYITFSGEPSRYHEANNVNLGEIWHRPEVKGKTRLVLVDALRPLCDKGPQPDPRYMWDYNGVIAGTDPVAVETVCLAILNEKRRALRGEPWPLSPPPLCVAAADEKYRLGTSRRSNIRIEKLGWTEGALV